MHYQFFAIRFFDKVTPAPHRRTFSPVLRTSVRNISEINYWKWEQRQKAVGKRTSRETTTKMHSSKTKPQTPSCDQQDEMQKNPHIWDPSPRCAGQLMMYMES